MTSSRHAEPLNRLESLPRLPLAFLPTPLLPSPNLRAVLGAQAPPILVKMDDWTGLALGGNKVRKLEFVFGQMDPGTHTVITCGGPQSNHCRVTAAAAAHLGLECILVVNGEPPDPPTGNSLLMRLFGAEVRPVAGREDRAPAMEEAAAEVRSQGKRPLIIPLGASTPLGALGYVRAAVELDHQMAERGGWGSGRTWVFLSSSSCGTLAGLALGFALLGREEVRLVGVSPDITAEEMVTTTRELVTGAAALLGTEVELPAGLVIPEDRFVGGGYGIPTTASLEAAAFFGRHAGMILDQTYTAKAGAGFLAWIREGRIPPGDTALFWHTGGAPAIFT
jgi:1-aminocyclopropane-1-carboxylate deaminase/D-cysteine desulfhydrase-like pyridoxal-dependent ACC family enzyme